MTGRIEITAQVLRDILRLDERTGSLTWRARPRKYFSSDHDCAAWNTRYAGQPALRSPHKAGYLQGCVLGRSMLAHRVAWAIQTGNLPEHEIDHINGDRSDNRSENLREVTHTENMRNTRLMRSNTSGVCGVHWNKARQKWHVYIRECGRLNFLGLYESKRDAIKVRRDAERRLGFHPNHGRASNG